MDIRTVQVELPHEPIYRTEVLSVRMTTNELSAIKKFARSLNMTVSGLVRSVLLGSARLHFQEQASTYQSIEDDQT